MRTRERELGLRTTHGTDANSPRAVAFTNSVWITVEDLGKALTRAGMIPLVTDEEYVSARSFSGKGGSASATLTPPGRAERRGEALTDLRELGETTEEKSDSTDGSDQIVDLGAHPE